jgi:hypothetical protein
MIKPLMMVIRAAVIRGVTEQSSNGTDSNQGEEEVGGNSAAGVSDPVSADNPQARSTLGHALGSRQDPVPGDQQASSLDHAPDRAPSNRVPLATPKSSPEPASPSDMRQSATLGQGMSSPDLSGSAVEGGSVTVSAQEHATAPNEVVDAAVLHRPQTIPRCTQMVP